MDDDAMMITPAAAGVTADNGRRSCTDIFRPMRQHTTLCSLQGDEEYRINLAASVDRGFTTHDQELICYRRNYFEIASAFDAFSTSTGAALSSSPSLTSPIDSSINIDASIGIKTALRRGHLKEKTASPLDDLRSGHLREKTASHSDDLRRGHLKEETASPSDDLRSGHLKEETASHSDDLRSGHLKEETASPSDDLRSGHLKEETASPSDDLRSGHQKEETASPSDDLRSGHQKEKTASPSDDLRSGHQKKKTASHSDDPSSLSAEGTPCCLAMDHTGTMRPIVGFAIGIRARNAADGSPVIIIQHTAKRDKGPQTIPTFINVAPGGDTLLQKGFRDRMQQWQKKRKIRRRTKTETTTTTTTTMGERPLGDPGDVGVNEHEHTNDTTAGDASDYHPSDTMPQVARFKRLQFKCATPTLPVTPTTQTDAVTTPPRRFNVLTVELFGITPEALPPPASGGGVTSEDSDTSDSADASELPGTGTPTGSMILLASIDSQNLVVRGRSPAYYANLAKAEAMAKTEAMAEAEAIANEEDLAPESKRQRTEYLPSSSHMPSNSSRITVITSPITLTHLSASSLDPFRRGSSSSCLSLPSPSTSSSSLMQSNATTTTLLPPHSSVVRHSRSCSLDSTTSTLAPPSDPFPDDSTTSRSPPALVHSPLPPKVVQQFAAAGTHHASTTAFNMDAVIDQVLLPVPVLQQQLHIASTMDPPPLMFTWSSMSTGIDHPLQFHIPVQQQQQQQYHHQMRQQYHHRYDGGHHHHNQILVMPHVPSPFNPANTLPSHSELSTMMLSDDVLAFEHQQQQQQYEQEAFLDTGLVDFASMATMVPVDEQCGALQLQQQQQALFDVSLWYNPAFGF